MIFLSNDITINILKICGYFYYYSLDIIDEFICIFENINYYHYSKKS